MKKARRTGKKRSPAWLEYRCQRNRVVKLLKTAHNDYLNNVIGGSLQENHKRFWSYIKRLRSDNFGIPVLRKGDSIFTSDKDKAEALNDYFQSVFTKDNDLLPAFSPTTPAYINNMRHIVFSPNGVLKQLASLNPSKSAGPDGISPRFLRDLSAEISSMLTFIFQQGYDTGTLPNHWLTAMVVPVHKKSSKENPANYRPISLTCLCCKAMEHTVVSKLNKHLSDNNILSHLQHGFRANLSCETQLVLTFHDWANTLNQHGQVDALLLDFSKAFHKVSHIKLQHKLAHSGINGKTLAWITAFLHNRTQFVVVNGTHSATTPVTTVFPQGSVLGPTLFLLFINNITQVTNSQLRLFADDAVLYKAINSLHDHQVLQEDLLNLTKWAPDWQMDFNVTKCHLLCIRKKGKPSKFTYTANSEALTRVSECDYLGVTCTETLRWGAHYLR